MSNNKQSSVEWFAEEINIHLNFDQRLYLRALIEKAKAMHKEEIVDSIVQYQIKHHDIFTEQEILNTVKKAEQYYEQTYGGNK